MRSDRWVWIMWIVVVLVLVYSIVAGDQTLPLQY